MGQRVTRRRFGLAAVVAASVATTGCTWEDDGNEAERAVNLEITLEDENGDPVSDGVVLSIEHEGGEFSVSVSSTAIEDGRYTAVNLIETGEYAVTVRSEVPDDEFDEIERTVTLSGTADPEGAEERAESITITLDGATSDVEHATANGA